MKLLVVNADDLGLSPGVNEGIVRAHQAGIVTSSSVIVNLPAFEGAVALAKKNPRLGVGVHVNLTCGPPVGSDESSLVYRRRRFHSLPQLLWALTLGRVLEPDVEEEMAAQVGLAIDAGLGVEHLDTHENIHFHPAIRRCLYRVAERYGVRWVRFRNQFPGTIRGLPTPITGTARNTLMQLIARRACGRPTGSADASLVQRTIFGAPMIRGCLQREWWCFVCRNVPAGVSEVACHPGYVDAELRQWDSYTQQRCEELEALLEPGIKVALREAGVRLVNYRQMRPDGTVLPPDLASAVNGGLT